MTNLSEAKQMAEEMDRAAMVMETAGAQDIAEGNRRIAKLIRDLVEEVELYRHYGDSHTTEQVRTDLEQRRKDRQQTSEDGR